MCSHVRIRIAKNRFVNEIPAQVFFLTFDHCGDRRADFFRIFAHEYVRHESKILVFKTVLYSGLNQREHGDSKTDTICDQRSRHLYDHHDIKYVFVPVNTRGAFTAWRKISVEVISNARLFIWMVPHLHDANELVRRSLRRPTAPMYFVSSSVI